MVIPPRLEHNLTFDRLVLPILSKGHIVPSLPGYDRWRRTHLGNISRKRSGEGPTYDAHPPAVPGLIRGNCTPVSVLGSLSRRTYRPSTRGCGGTAALHYRNITSCEHPGGLFAPASPFTHRLRYVAQNGSSGRSQRSYPGKEGRI